ncbi:VapC toxin family PIN domain ribonuclease [candidate division WWE3 bacterium CG10_big_fil_rev_8_21_14_0_10_32_10]|uniref:Ribonuclease VapC n=1 Tax=candidate division WWE3 bacterium CG10_big_fil_rev_8_21_14_0_10_32_10 TaxID=1975090 RepID=A0A2H0RBE8_UNCKA|nr:MAG: VapC toxin family PIN domain ribonuclease [candidate division WWE3 bacterium CG10_big_fil_rev_8_21_14_0_10_32_10]
MYLLDTNIIIDHLRIKEGVIQKEWVSPGYISFVTYSELFYGVYKSKFSKKNLLLLSDFLEENEIIVINSDNKTCEYFGRLKAHLEKRGRRIEDADLFIAATAITNNLVLVTQNNKHFRKIEDLKIHTHSQ